MTNMDSNTVTNFCKQFGAEFNFNTESYPVHSLGYSVPDYYAGRSTVTLTLAPDNFARLVTVSADIEKEERLRFKHPALADAYVQYQTLLTLVK